MITLFPDQQDLQDDLREAMKRHKNILLQAATGSGKTALSVDLINKAHNKGTNVIFCVPRIPLMEQTSDTFNQYGIKHSYVASGKPMNPYAKAHIGMIDTMARRLDILPKAKLVIVDECHYGAGNLDKVIGHYKSQGSWVCGLSATPWKLSGQGLRKYFDYMVQGKPIDWLIKNHRLSDYRYFQGITKPDLSKVGVNGGDYAKGELADFMEHQGVIIGDCVNDYLKRCNGRLHLVRCASIKHSQMTAESFRNAGVPFVHVDGETPKDEQKRIYRAFARREILGLTFCDLLNFGFDLSQASGMDVCVESGSDLKPSKSLAGQLQWWGRMLRYKPYPAIINDHVNNYIEHGLPCSEREWTLEDRSQGKRNSERVPPVRQCPKCFFCFSPRPICPNCNHTLVVKSREIEEMAGELQEINKEEVRKKERIEQGMANSLEELIEAGKKRGYKNPTFWASRVWTARVRGKKK